MAMNLPSGGSNDAAGILAPDQLYHAALMHECHARMAGACHAKTPFTGAANESPNAREKN
jgi:hypothetical protein